GIYDIAANIGYLTIGISHDTAKFVCDNIERVWTEYLQWQYPNADTVCSRQGGLICKFIPTYFFNRYLAKYF
nr:hypothetical protein [Prevotella sp.]